MSKVYPRTVGQRLGLLTGFGLIFGGAMGWVYALLQAPRHPAATPAAVPRPVDSVAEAVTPDRVAEAGDLADEPISTEQPGGSALDAGLPPANGPADDEESPSDVDAGFAADVVEAEDGPQSDVDNDRVDETGGDEAGVDEIEVVGVEVDDVDGANLAGADPAGAGSNKPASVGPPQVSPAPTTTPPARATPTRTTPPDAVPDAVKAIRAAAAAARGRLESPPKPPPVPEQTEVED